MSLYPKMLYKGNEIYTDSEQIKEDLFSKKLHTIIVADEDQELIRREQGYVDLCDLMQKPKEKIPLGLPKVKADVRPNTA